VADPLILLLKRFC